MSTTAKRQSSISAAGRVTPTLRSLVETTRSLRQRTLWAKDGQWWHLKGLTIQNSAYYGVNIYGSQNTVEQLVLRDNKASGLEITGKEGCTPSNNLVLSFDSYHKFDPQGNGEDADGFSAKFITPGPGNVLRGLRSCSNSDDGYDFWHAAHPVLIEQCWSFDNGFSRSEWADQISGA